MSKNKLKTFIIALLALNCIIFSQDGILSLSINIDKTEYFINESIMLEVSLFNMSSDSIFIDPGALSSSERIIQVFSSDGTLIQPQKGTWGCGERHGVTYNEVIKPYDKLTRKFNLLEAYGEIVPSTVNWYSLDSLGVYEVKCVFNNSFEFAESISGRRTDLWMGTLVSNIIQFEIIPFTEYEINKLSVALQSSDEDELFNALVTVRKAQITNLLYLVNDILPATNSEKIRYEAARMMMEYADEKYFDLYIESLNSSHRTTRAFGAICLGRIKDKRAVPYLIELCDQVKYPHSYNVAARSLLFIGDKRAIPVVQKIVDSQDVNTVLHTVFTRELEELKSKTD
ncbi:MAG: HEAT repeat domain-containing protein [Candidatus Marinimicrobia bacterium]|jgi:hypothetical protein|nr:HEAT repeat domain-containing protein [Candidatus Neomarinimicrobiota bacterium]MBT3634995.1 HEAT repeat domain-containing protein [Candidatus Neomarinimicrobiota bacterium]MBT3683826.1 HEAT repeat domain-containing protein [Candidatus Neomarinimicrobiota bacterium]MBT3760647.1 HEAT repeat domain-containing protein [Candidatus Neomarinimicrobiota bacterium]MBT3896836.1 HEAT repeat domain-containing protein [Candidatus Neomarinimicrobiota bacterium]